MTNTRENPYVGPHAFEIKDKKKFYARDRDILAIYRLLIAERIVLLFSPSGAGKSSLVNAGLRPRMIDKRFKTYPVARVNLPVPEDLAAKGKINPYVMSVLQSLEGARTGTSNEQLAGLTLNDYLEHRLSSGSDSDHPEITEDKFFFIFDQFEEILTVNPNDYEGKQEFFAQLGEALDAPRRWALFVVREDYVAALDPYLHFLPTRLANRYRLDLLDADSAKEAICKPAKELMDVSYEPEAVEYLLKELRSVRIQRPDGSWEPEPQEGRYIEPVQLQVVCRRLWEKIDEDNVITKEEVTKLGSVDQSLAEFYAEKVEETAEQVSVPEKDIRTWFDTALITPSGIRSQVMWEEGKSGGLDNNAIAYLDKTHLIRSESRRGVKWLELAHDRLIKPVLDSNKNWFEQNLSPLQRHAMMWAAEKEPDRLLLRDDELAEAEAWAKDKTLTENEQKFLMACIDLRERLQAEAKRKEAEALAERNKVLAEKNSELAEKNEELDTSNKRQRTLFRNAVAAAIVAAVLAVFALLASREAITQRDKAEQFASDASKSAQVAAEKERNALNKKIEAEHAQGIAEYRSLVSNASQLAAQSILSADADPPLAILLALEALNMTERESKPPLPVAEEALRTALGSQRGFLLSGHTGQIQSLAISNNEHWLATVDNKGNILLWDLTAQNLLESSVPLVELQGLSFTNVLFSPDSNYLVAGTDDGSILIVSLPEKTAQDMSWVNVPLNPNLNEEISAIAASPDEDWFAVGGSNGTVNLYNFKSLMETENFEPIRLPSSGILPITALKFSPDGSKLAAGSTDYLARLWSVTNPQNTPASLPTQGPISSLDFSPDSAYLAIGAEQIIYVWNTKAPTNPPDTYQTTASRITVLTFDPNESSEANDSSPRQLFVGYENGSIAIWRGSDNTLNTPSPDDIIQVTDAEITHLSFSPDGRWLLTGSRDHLARLFDLNQLNSPPRILRRFGDPITAAVISPKGTWISVASDNTEAHLWNLKAGLEIVEPLNLPGGPFAFDQAGTILVTGPQDVQLAPLLAWNFNDLDELKKISSEIRNNESDQLPMTSLAISQNGRWLAGCDTNGNVHIKDMKDSNTALRVLKGGPNDKDEFCWKIAFTVDGRYLITLEDGVEKGTIKVWDLRKTDFVNSDPQIINPPHDGFIRALAFSDDGGWMATGSDGGSASKGVALLWDLNKLSSGKPVLTIPDHAGWVNTVAFSPDGQWLVTGDDNGDIRLKSLSDTKKSPIVVPAHEGWVNVVAFSPDGQYLASGGTDGTIRLWLVLKDRIDENAFTFYSHEGPVWDLAFSPDKNWLASASSDNTARLWNLLTRSRDAVVLKGFGDIVAQVDFTTDGRWLVTGSGDGTTRLWHMGLDQLRELGCQMAGRNLTPNEWAQFINNGTSQKNVYDKTCVQYDLSDEEPADIGVTAIQEDGLSQSQVCSERTDVSRVTLTFTNNSDNTINVYWIDFNCEPVFYGTLLPGDSYKQETFATYPWIFINSETGDVLKDFVAGTSDATVTIP